MSDNFHYHFSAFVFYTWVNVDGEDLGIVEMDNNQQIKCTDNMFCYCR